MTDDDDDWAPPPVPDGDGDPVAAVDEAFTEAELALVAFEWLPDDDELDAAATILHHTDQARQRPDTPLRRVLHQALGETYPQLTAWRPRPHYLYAVVKTLHQLASDRAAQEDSAALLVGWDRLIVLLRQVIESAGGAGGSGGAGGAPSGSEGPGARS
ncbi:hypothetical protein ACG83_24675 [Frankia sp. R43]|uniref:hypothetical protein n=1 Tax=Frankia sp. R43 TaxID=269536 RepID=UPI0006CA2D2C|nr:hypothetical protein [Frankia sp. R43]KPM53776.1 hypothetical protein ACG83_24675 [Frankia sp. R43]